MMSLSGGKTPIAAQDYFRDQYVEKDEAYYSQGGQVTGEWQGRLAAKLGLKGQVKQEDFARLSEGRHPATGQQLVQHRASVEYTDANGKEVKTVEHRAGNDATFSAPKSVSLTALVGGDERLTAAHRTAVEKALFELERYTDARLSGDQKERTGKLVAAKFEHDTARPVKTADYPDGYAAPQLHTHCFIFNVTQTADGRTRSLQTAELFNARAYATAVYRAELAAGARALGYHIERGEHGKFEIQGYTADYLKAESPRSEQINRMAAERGQEGPAAKGLIALETREKKLHLTHDQLREMHQQHAAQYGHEPRAVVKAARSRQHFVTAPTADELQRATRQAVRYAVKHQSERSAAFSERAVLKTALDHGQGQVKTDGVRAAFRESIARGEIIRRDDGKFTTREAQTQERQNIERMLAGRGKLAPLADEQQQARALQDVARAEKLTLSQDQRQAAQQILSSRDRFTALDGRAGTGKTTTLSVIRAAAELAGYEIKGLAPSHKAARVLAEAGMKTTTLLKHLVAGGQSSGQPRLLILDESSLASTNQVHALMQKLGSQDRILFVGDPRQHEAVEAGRPVAQLREAGISTGKLTEIRRQKDPKLREAVEYLAKGKTKEAIEQLASQGRIQEIADRGERIQAIARNYAERPHNTLVISPDNASRREINHAIRAELQQRGTVDTRDHATKVLEARDLTGANRKHAQYYRQGDVVRYSRKSRGFAAGESARVVATDTKHNTLTVAKAGGEPVTYDPRRLQGVQVYREGERTFSQGDRVQTTVPISTHKLAGRELGTIQKIDRGGNITVRFDGPSTYGRTVKLDAAAARHLDHGYAITSFSSQGSKAARVLIHADTKQSAELLNQRMTYVAVSRAVHEVKLYTNSAQELGAAMSRDRSHSQALTRPLNWEDRQSSQESGRNRGAATKSPQRTPGVVDLRKKLGLDKPASGQQQKDTGIGDLRAKLGLKRAGAGADQDAGHLPDGGALKWFASFVTNLSQSNAPDRGPTFGRDQAAGRGEEGAGR